MAKVIIFVMLISGLSYLAGSIAKEKNRDFWKIFWFSMFLSPFGGPIIGILIAYFLEKYKYCKYCCERIKLKAVVCKYCSKDQLESDIIDVEFEEVDQANKDKK